MNVSDKVNEALSKHKAIKYGLSKTFLINLDKLSIGVEVLKRIREANETFNALSKSIIRTSGKVM